MFIDNKYTRWYHQIIDRARDRENVGSGYCETHHIVPRSLGGPDNKRNLVVLSAREHFIVHWLLTKMVSNTKHKYQMWNAFSCMLYRARPGQIRYKVSSRVFESIKRAGSKIKSERFTGSNNPMFGRRGELSPHFGKEWSDEHRVNASKSHKGVIRSLESRQKQSVATKGREQSIEHIEKRKLFGEKNPRFGYKMTPEEIAHRTATLKANKLAKKLAQGDQRA